MVRPHSRHSIVDCPFGRLARTLAAAFDRPPTSFFPNPARPFPKREYNYEPPFISKSRSADLQFVDASQRFLIRFSNGFTVVVFERIEIYTNRFQIRRQTRFRIADPNFHSC